MDILVRPRLACFFFQIVSNVPANLIAYYWICSPKLLDITQRFMEDPPIWDGLRVNTPESEYLPHILPPLPPKKTCWF